jgi:hypothetical protein
VQFCHPERGESLVFAYRLQDFNARQRFRLHGLNPAHSYTVRTHPAAGEAVQLSGAELMDFGLEVTLPRPGTAQVLVIG